MKRLLLLTCVLFQLFCLKGMAVKEVDTWAMGLPMVLSPESSELSSLQEGEQFEADLKPINDVEKRAAGTKKTPLFFNGQTAKFQLQLFSDDGNGDKKLVENLKDEGWTLSWTLDVSDFVPVEEGDGIYSFKVVNDGSEEEKGYDLKCTLNDSHGQSLFVNRYFYVSTYDEPKASLADTLYVNLADSQVATLKVTTEGGTDYWTYEWSENGEPFSPQKEECKIDIDYDKDKGLEREIKLIVKNSRYEDGHNPWYEKTFICHVIFREKYELTLAMNQKPERKEWNVLSGTKVDIEYLLKNVTQDNLVQNPEGDEEGWKADWNRDPQPEKVGQTSYKFTPIYEGTDEFSNETLKLTLTNKEKSPELTDSLVFHVYPKPSIETNKEEVENGNPHDAGEEVELIVTPKGGNKDRWIYSWTDVSTGKDLGNDSICTVTYGGLVSHTITLVATTKSPGDEQWSDNQCKDTIVIEFKQPGEYSVRLSSDHKNVYAGQEVPIDVYLTLVDDETGGTKKVNWIEDGWTPTWEPSNAVTFNEEDSTFTFTPKLSSGEIPEVQTLTLTLKNENYSYKQVPTQTITFNVYPTPNATQEPDFVITATIGRPVELKIHTEGGYDGDGGWSFEWTDNDVLQKDVIGDTYTIEDNGTPERVVAVKVKNYGPDKDTWYDKDFTFKVTFVKNPYTVELMTIPENKEDVLDREEVKVIYRLLEDGEPVKSLDGWTPTWVPNERVVTDKENQKSCIFTVQYDKDNAIDSYSEDKLTLTLMNEKLDAFASGSIVFRVYQQPSAKPVKEVIEADMDEDVTLEIVTEGGYDQGWTFEWPESDEFTESDDNKCVVKYDGQNLTRTIKAIVRNTAYNEDVVLFGPETIEFTVVFKNPYSIELETEPEGIRDVLDGDSVTTNFRLLHNGTVVSLLDKEWTIELTPEYSYELKEDGSGSFNYKAKHNGEEENPITEKVMLKICKDGVNPITNWIEFNVYQRPDAHKDPADDPIIAYTNESKALSVVYVGGNPDGWTFEWTEDGRDIKGKGNEYLAEYTDRPSRTIHVKAVNVSPDGVTWFEEDFEFVIEFREPLSYEVKLSVDDENVLDGNDVQLSFTLYKVENETRSEVNDLGDWTLTWDPEELIQNKGGKYFFTAQYQGDDESWEQPIKLTLKKDEFEVSDNATFVIWPQPVITDGQEWMDAAEFKDLNNPLNKLQKGIRAGNKLELPEETPDISITHEWEGYEWKYVWSVDGKEYDSVVDIPTRSDDTYTIEITCVAQYTNGKNVMWEKEVGTKTLKVYKMPATPTYFVQKGNGTSNTWIISGFTKSSSKDRLAVGTFKTNAGQTEVKAITENINATITDNGMGWFIMEGHKDAKDLCLYAVRDYGDNVVITSDILPVNLTSAVNWDGSTYENRGILPQSAPSVTGVYSIDGVKTNSMVRGLNIIRLEDGTVRKVFKK